MFDCAKCCCCLPERWLPWVRCNVAHDPREEVDFTQHGDTSSIHKEPPVTANNLVLCRIQLQTNPGLNRETVRCHCVLSEYILMSEDFNALCRVTDFNTWSVMLTQKRTWVWITLPYKRMTVPRSFRRLYLESKYCTRPGQQTKSAVTRFHWKYPCS